MERITAKYLDHKRNGPHDNCGADYGYLGSHATFKVAYLCSCGARVDVDQCSAWPITDKDCPTCYAPITCEMPQARTTARLR